MKVCTVCCPSSTFISRPLIELSYLSSRCLTQSPYPTIVIRSLFRLVNTSVCSSFPAGSPKRDYLVFIIKTPLHHYVLLLFATTTNVSVISGGPRMTVAHLLGIQNMTMNDIATTGNVLTHVGKCHNQVSIKPATQYRKASQW